MIQYLHSNTVLYNKLVDIPCTESAVSQVGIGFCFKKEYYEIWNRTKSKS